MDYFFSLSPVESKRDTGLDSQFSNFSVSEPLYIVKSYWCSQQPMNGKQNRTIEDTMSFRYVAFIYWYMWDW